MRILIAGSTWLVVAACALGPGCASPERRAPVAAPAAPGDGAQPAREVLVQHCGHCHRSDLPTAVPGALAVFDLTQEHWYLSLSQEQLESLLRRMRANREVAPEDLAAVEAFAAGPSGTLRP